MELGVTASIFVAATPMNASADSTLRRVLFPRLHSEALLVPLGYGWQRVVYSHRLVGESSPEAEPRLEAILPLAAE